MTIFRHSGLNVMRLFISLIGASCLASEMPDDPEKVLDEIFSFDSMRGWESAVRENPDRFRTALKRRANEELPALEQVKLVELGFFVFDENIFRREADEALKGLREISETDPIVTQYIDRVEYLVKVRPGFDDEGLNTEEPREDGLVRPDTKLGVDEYSSGGPHSEPTGKHFPRSPASATICTYVVVAFAFFGIFVVLVRSRKRRTPR